MTSRSSPRLSRHDDSYPYSLTQLKSSSQTDLRAGGADLRHALQNELLRHSSTDLRQSPYVTRRTYQDHDTRSPCVTRRGYADPDTRSPSMARRGYADPRHGYTSQEDLSAKNPSNYRPPVRGRIASQDTAPHPRHEQLARAGSSGSAVRAGSAGREQLARACSFGLEDAGALSTSPGVMRPDKSPMSVRSTRVAPQSPHLGASPKPGPRDSKLSPFIYRPRPRSIATDVSYGKLYSDSPISPEYDCYRSSTSNLLQGSMQAGLREEQHGDVRKWGSCSRLEYGHPQYSTPPTHNMHYPIPQERTDGDGGPSSYQDPHYNPYHRRHSSSKVSSHSGSSHSDDVIMAQKAELEEKNRVIESLKMRVSEADGRVPERAFSDKSGEHGAIAESLDSGIDIRSESGVMKPLFSGQQRPDERNEVARLKLHVKQLENRLYSGVSSSNFEEEQRASLEKIERLVKENGTLSEAKTSISRKFSRLQEYLTTLPTVKEYNDLKERSNQLAEENKSIQEEHKKTGDTSKDAKQKEADLKKYQKKCIEMRDNVQKLEKQNGLLRSQNAAQAKQELQKVEQEKAKMDKKLEQLRKEIAVLSEQKETHKNLVGGYYEKYNNEHETNKILSCSLDKSAGEVEELRNELSESTRAVERLNDQITDLQTELSCAHSKIEELENMSQPADNTGVLMQEFNGAFHDLNSVVEVCQMGMAGQTPNITLLLGLGSSFSLDNTTELSLDDRIKDIRKVRSDIEYLRNQLSDMYAVEMGNRCPTQ